MAPVAGSDMLGEVMVRGAEGGNGSIKPAYFMNARDDFFILFHWAKMTPENIAYGLVAVFIFSVVATMAVQMLRQFEREVLRRRQNQVGAGLRLGAASAYTLRMAFIYITICLLVTENVWVFLSLLVGHFVGWVIYSSLGEQLTQQDEDEQRDPTSTMIAKFDSYKNRKSMDDDESSDSV